MESQITIRLFLDEVDPAKAANFVQMLREHLAPIVDVIQWETGAYWKIPEWFEVFFVARPFAETKAPSAFQAALAALGEGWQRGVNEWWEKHVKPDDEEQWEVWTSRPGSSFFHQSVRWANVELFRVPPQER